MYAAAVAAVAVFINGVQVILPTAAIQRGNTVLVPVKGVFDRLGARVHWDAEARRVAVSNDTMRLVLTLGSAQAELNGQPIELGAAPELREGNTLVPLRLIATALGADIAWDQERRRVYLETGPIGPPVATTVGALVSRPHEWAGRLVIVSGEYRGWQPSPFSPATRNGTPVSRCDWVFRDATGEIYCRGDIAVSTPFPLTPYSSVGNRLTVLGIAKVAQRGFAFLEPREILQPPTIEGVVCTVDTSRRVYLPGEPVRVHLTVANPLSAPMVLDCRPGPRHDIVLRGREGGELWRLSSVSPAPPSPGTVELQPGDRVHIEEVWSPGSADSPILPPGRYAVEAEFGGVLKAFPHLIAIVPRDE